MCRRVVSTMFTALIAGAGTCILVSCSGNPPQPAPVPAAIPAPAATTDQPSRPAAPPTVVVNVDTPHVALGTMRTTPRVASAPTSRPAPIRRAEPRSSMALPGARNDTIAERERKGSVRICAGGDVTLGTNLDAAWARTASHKMKSEFGLSDQPDSLIAPLKPLVADADIVLLNVESAIGSGKTPSKCGRKSRACFAFRAPRAAAHAIANVAPGKIVVGNVANNHSHDAGNAGRDTTIALLVKAGVLVTGVDTLATPVRTPAGDTIGVLGFYTSPETPDARDTAAVYRHVARAVREYGVVIVTMHLGAEGAAAQRTMNRSEIFLKNIDRGNPVAFADAAVRGGASLVIGHGPHVLRAMEWREHGALIAYSLGNLLTYGPFHLTEPMNRGAVFCATLDQSGRASSASITSTMQLSAGVMQRDTTNRATALVDSLTRLDFPGTGASVQRDGTIRPLPR